MLLFFEPGRQQVVNSFWVFRLLIQVDFRVFVAEKKDYPVSLFAHDTFPGSIARLKDYSFALGVTQWARTAAYTVHLD